MEKYTDHTLAGRAGSLAKRVDIKEAVILLAVELGMLMMAVYKGIGLVFIPITLLMMAFTIGTYMIISLYGADITFLVLVLVLMNLGFLIQLVQYGGQVHVISFLKKLLVAIAVTLAAGMIYRQIKKWFSKFYVIAALMALQLCICAAMLLAGKVIGTSTQGAAISLGGITPFELVKFLYIFVAAGLLCNNDEDGEWVRICGFRINKDVVLIVHTILLSVFFVLCSELGTLMIVGITGFAMLWMFGKSRKLIGFLLAASVIIFVLGWITCVNVLLPMVTENPHMLPGVITKVIYRFGTALHPENYRLSYGYQGTCGLEAIAEGGLLGISTERYRLSLPEAGNDYIFANVVQTCGMVMGIVVILFFFILLNKGMKIAEECKNEYFGGVASAITIVIAAEAVIHIGYNVAAFPVTGIPLYFVSQGFTAIVTGMGLIAILLVITAENRAGSEAQL